MKTQNAADRSNRFLAKIGTIWKEKSPITLLEGRRLYLGNPMGPIYLKTVYPDGALTIGKPWYTEVQPNSGDLSSESKRLLCKDQ